MKLVLALLGHGAVASLLEVSSGGALVELEKMRVEIESHATDCHSKVREVLLSSAEGEIGCEDECVKMTLALTLANCVLSLQSHGQISCTPTQNCTLEQGCLTQQPASKKASSLSMFGWKEEVLPHFDTPTQQSIVFSESYSHIDSICVYLSSVSMVDKQVQLARALRTSSLETLSLVRTAEVQGR